MTWYGIVFLTASVGKTVPSLVFGVALTTCALTARSCQHIMFYSHIRCAACGSFHCLSRCCQRHNLRQYVFFNDATCLNRCRCVSFFLLASHRLHLQRYNDYRLPECNRGDKGHTEGEKADWLAVCVEGGREVYGDQGLGLRSWWVYSALVSRVWDCRWPYWRLRIGWE